MHTAPAPDAFAALLGIDVRRQGSGRAEARLVVSTEHLNPHGTTHGAVLFSLGGVALAAAANDAEHSGMVSAVHIDYMQPSGAGDALVASASVVERLAREDLFAVRVVRASDGEVVARMNGRATRRPRRDVGHASGQAGRDA